MGRGLQLRGVLEAPPPHGGGQEYIDAVLGSGGRAELDHQESHFNPKKSMWGTAYKLTHQEMGPLLVLGRGTGLD